MHKLESNFMNKLLLNISKLKVHESGLHVIYSTWMTFPKMAASNLEVMTMTGSSMYA